MKKSIFGVMNFLLPPRDVLPMHCSANVGADGVTGPFLWPLGNGQNHPLRRSRAPIDRRRRARLERRPGFSILKAAVTPNASTLTKENEPQIYRAIRFGWVLENVVLDPHQPRALIR